MNDKQCVQCSAPVFAELECSACGARQPAAEDNFVFVNLTPHDINVRQESTGELRTIPASGKLARVAETRTELPSVMGFKLSRAEYGAIEGLPDPELGTIYIVSAIVAVRAYGRTDVVCPGPAIRDEAGRIIGCEGFSAAPGVPNDIANEIFYADKTGCDSYGYGGWVYEALNAARKGLEWTSHEATPFRRAVIEALMRQEAVK